MGEPPLSKINFQPGLFLLVVLKEISAGAAASAGPQEDVAQQKKTLPSLTVGFVAASKESTLTHIRNNIIGSTKVIQIVHFVVF